MTYDPTPCCSCGGTQATRGEKRLDDGRWVCSAQCERKAMTQPSQKWVQDRTTQELIQWHRLLTYLNWPPEGDLAKQAMDPRHRHVRALELEIAVRQARQVGFMDRLDVKT